MALCYEKFQKFPQALKWFSYASEINEELDSAYYGKSLCYLKMGKARQALAEIEKAIAAVRNHEQ